MRPAALPVIAGPSGAWQAAGPQSESGAAGLADDVVEVGESRLDAPPGGLRGQVHGNLQTEPGVEMAKHDRALGAPGLRPRA